MGRPVYAPSSDWSQERKSSRDSEIDTTRILLERQKDQILAEVRTEIQKHEFQADSDRRSVQELNGIIESQRREIDHTIASDEQSRRDQLLQEQLLEQNRDLREAHIKSLHEMEELSSVQESRVDESSRRRLIENQDTVNELTARIQELQNEVNCMIDSRDFKDAESVRSGLSHVPSQPVLLPLYRDPGGLLSRNNQPPDIWNSQGISGNVFANPTASSSAPYPGGFNPWISNVTEETGPSARNSFDPQEGRFSKNHGADQQRLQISEHHFDKFPSPATFACWKIRLKSEVCTCSQFPPTEAMLWIKVVEMVESVDDLKSSRSIRRTQGPDFEVLDVKIASALNRIIQNTRFKKKSTLEEMKAQKEDCFLR